VYPLGGTAGLLAFPWLLACCYIAERHNEVKTENGERLIHAMNLAGLQSPRFLPSPAIEPNSKPVPAALAESLRR
jgi:hypothetical protein